VPEWRAVCDSAGAAVLLSNQEVPVVRLKDKEREFLENPYVGILTEHRPDGSLHTTPVWVDADGRAEVSFNTARGRLKEKDIACDSRVSLLVVDPDDPYRWVSVSGKARFIEEGADEQIDELAQKYLGEERYPNRAPGEERVTVAIEPEKIESYGLDS
jgi:PPOX class probable F420-dependent enzyme